MARRKSTASKSRGSSLFSLLAGLIIGLGIAAGVAWFVTQVPMPFVDKASRDPANVLLPDVRDAPDPNQGLYRADAGAGSPASGPTVSTPTPLPGQEPSKAPGSMADDIGNLLETLRSAPASTISKPATPQADKPQADHKPTVAATQTTYYLQAGAFRSLSDADSIKAQILLMGMPVEIQQAQLNGSTINRVRVGPFKGIDEMNKSRVRLAKANIESSVVRP